MFKRVQFGPDAAAYIRIRLSTQGTLWRSLAELPLERGQVCAYLPPTVSSRDLLFFEWHLHSREALETRSVDYEYRVQERHVLFNYLEHNTERMLVLYRDTVPPGGHIQNQDGPVSNYFHVLTYPDFLAGEVRRTETYSFMPAGIDRREMDIAIDNAEQRPFLCALTSFPGGMRQFPSDKQLSTDLIQELARRTTGIMVGAYGGDANLLWTEHGVSELPSPQASLR